MSVIFVVLTVIGKPDCPHWSRSAATSKWKDIIVTSCGTDARADLNKISTKLQLSARGETYMTVMREIADILLLISISIKQRQNARTCAQAKHLTFRP